MRDRLLSRVKEGKLKCKMKLAPFDDFNTALDKALGKLVRDYTLYLAFSSYVWRVVFLGVCWFFRVVPSALPSNNADLQFRALVSEQWFRVLYYSATDFGEAESHYR
ncbi:hypothetical protein JHK82_055377 [Glycine max]|nr:hypothetical protein JHK86_055215 [Glycine max]KAG5074010.1 hypothetical protein JHK84_055241 [Glycine max]KAG5076682.1 hypothetical protein JHK82_055377 [Glycine max]